VRVEKREERGGGRVKDEGGGSKVGGKMR